MSAGIYVGIAAVLLIAGLGFLCKFLFEKNRDLKDDLQDEKERSNQLRKAMANTVELSEKADEIDRTIEEKKNERKKLSKSQKIAAANNRGSGN